MADGQRAKPGESLIADEYSPAFQDEYRRLWHEAEARAKRAEEALRIAASWIAALPVGRPDSQATCAYVPRDIHDRIQEALARD